MVKQLYPFIIVGLLLLVTGCGLGTAGGGEEPSAKTMPYERIKVRGKITKLTLFKKEDREKEPFSQTGDPSEPTSSKEDPSIGKVSEGVRGSMMVEGDPGQKADYDKAQVTITKDTQIFRQEGEGRLPATLKDLREGGEVIVHLIGPVAESDPPQGTAGIIVIIN